MDINHCLISQLNKLPFLLIILTRIILNEVSLFVSYTKILIECDDLIPFLSFKATWFLNSKTVSLIMKVFHSL